MASMVQVPSVFSACASTCPFAVAGSDGDSVIISNNRLTNLLTELGDGGLSNDLPSVSLVSECVLLRYSLAECSVGMVKSFCCVSKARWPRGRWVYRGVSNLHGKTSSRVVYI